jgi:hypothetical protein
MTGHGERAQHWTSPWNVTYFTGPPFPGAEVGTKGGNTTSNKCIGLHAMEFGNIATQRPFSMPVGRAST